MQIMKCPFCGTEIKDPTITYCGSCGRKLFLYNDESDTVKHNKNKIGIASLVCGISGLLLSCLVIGIIPSVVGLVLSVIALNKYNENNGISIAGAVCSSVGIILSFIMILFIILIPTDEKTDNSASTNTETVINTEIPPSDTKDSPQSSQTAKDVPKQTSQEIEKQKTDSTEKKNKQKKESKFLTELKKDLDEKVAEKAYKILKDKLGFTKLEYQGKTDGTTNYNISANDYNLVLTASDNVYRIFIPHEYSLYEDGKVKMTFSDLQSKTIDNTQMTAYYIMAKEIVTNNLKHPKSADFPSIITHASDIAMQKNGDIVAVQSYVDAQNSFGATIRSNWMVEFKVLDIDSYSYDVIYINIDGTESGKYKELE